MPHQNRSAVVLDGSNVSRHEAEANIVSLLASAQEVDSKVLSACEQFEILLADVLRLLAGNRRSRYWQLDDLSCDFISRTRDVVTLKGVSNWLSGGDGCDRFRLDVSLNSKPLLYSYKFMNSISNEQILYVGKTPSGWLVNGP